MSVGIVTFAILIFTSLVGSGISVVAGFGGGLLVFAALAATLEFVYVIPMHGAVMLSANIARVTMFWKDVDRNALKFFSVTFLPAAALSTVAWYYLIETASAQPYIKIAIALFLILFTLVPNFEVKSTNRIKIMMSAGLICGLLVMLFNVGPLLVPFLIALDLKKNAFIGTFAFVTMVVTVAKVPLFFLIADKLSFDIGLLTVLMIVACIVGSYAGKAISGQVSERLFKTIVKIILMAISLKMLIWDGARVLLAGS
jgi:uncharacterized membrane protein YfcA